jgi:hypothetical protein
MIEHISDLADEVFGTGRRLAGVERLRGGSKKGVYRLSADDGFSAILYVWSEEEDFWPASTPGDAADPFAHASGLELFESSRTLLEDLGVRVPRLYFADRSGERHPADIAVVEDVRGGTLEARLRDDPQGAGRTLDDLAAGLSAMSRCRERRLGKVAHLSDEESCAGVVLRRALRDLAEAAGRVERIAAVRESFEAALGELAAVVEPRPDHGLIHGELGPDHVLVDDRGAAVLIDIEGTMFFDLEWEHVFLRMRFGEHYERLRVDGLDDRRMRFYQLAQHLSLVAGPLRLLDGDFPDREVMMGIATFHIEAALGFLRAMRD